MAVSVDPFVHAFFAIDTDNSESITVAELQAYAMKNNLHDSFHMKWMELFDKNKDQTITLEEFCSVLGLVPKEVRALRNSTLESSRRNQLPPDVTILSADMGDEMQRDVVFTMRDLMAKYGEREAAKALKQYLDQKYDRLWHVVTLVGQFWAYYSHEPEFSLHFKMGRHIYLMWKTPGY